MCSPDFGLIFLGMQTLYFTCNTPLTNHVIQGWLNVAMHERYEVAISASTTKVANHVNEIADSIKTVAALGREREIMRVFHLQAQSTPKGTRTLVLGCAGLGLSQGTSLLTGALMFYWSSQRLADGAVSDFSQGFNLRDQKLIPSARL